MTFDIVVEDRARVDVVGIYLDLKAHARDADYADVWLDELHGALASLAEFPRRCPLGAGGSSP